MTIAVCDDNVLTLRDIKKNIISCITNYTDKYKIIEFENGRDLLNQHNNSPFDIVFLDIDMPVTTGFDVAKELRNNFSNCYIVFVTSYSEFVYDSFSFQPFNFIRKNCNIPLAESISDVVDKLMKHMKQNERIILEDYDYGKHSIYIRDIVYIESDKHHVIYYTLSSEHPIRIRNSISECEEKYREYDFVRIHKGYLINLRYLSGIDCHYNEVILGKICKRLPMSKRMKNNVKEKYDQYLRTKV